VLVLDGAQWADSDSLAVLDEALAHLLNAPVLLVVTARSGWSHPWPNQVTTVSVGRLPPEDCAQLLAHLLGPQPVAPEVVALLTEQSAGDPLLLEEMVQAYREGGSVSLGPDGVWRLGGRGLGQAHSLRTIVQARLDRLPPPERQVLQVAAVSGHTWTAGLLAKVVRGDLPVAEILHRLAEHSYLSERSADPEPVYAFAHGITREVLYANHPVSERRRLHVRIAEALERQYDPARPDPAYFQRIADHFEQGQKAERAIEYLLRSGDAAAALFANESALAQYARALGHAEGLKDLAQRRPRVAEVQERRGDVLLRQSNFAEAQLAFEAAHQVADEPPSRARLGNKLAVVAARRGNHRRVLELAEANLAHGELDPATHSATAARVALSLSRLGDARQAAERAQQALKLLEAPGLAAGLGAPTYATALGLAAYAVGAARLLLGDLAGAQAALERSAAARRQVRDAAGQEESLTLLAQVHAERGEFAHGLLALRAATRATSHMDPDLGEDDLAALERHFRDAPEEGRHLQDAWSFACRSLALGRLLVTRGQPARGAPYVAEAVALAERIGARDLAVETRVHHARAALGAGQGVEAVAALRPALAAAEALELQPLACEAQMLLAAALAEQGTGTEALEAGEQALVRARMLNLRLHEAMGRRLVAVSRANVGDWETALHDFETSERALERLGAQPELVRTLLAFAAAEQAQSPQPRPAEVRARLARALGLAEALGLESELAAARALRASLPA
jgi:tetratricopeptide (TPR) repeat protein